MNIHLRERLAHHHDQTWIRHNQCIRSHINNRFQIANEGFQLGVMRGDIHHDVEFFTQRMGLVNAELQILVIEFVIAHPQTVTRLARVNGVRAIGKSVTHIFQRSRRRQEFWFKHDVLVLMSGQNRLIRRGGLGRGLSPTLKAGIVALRGAEVKRGALPGNKPQKPNL